MAVRFNSKINRAFERRLDTDTRLLPSGLVESGEVQLITQLDKHTSFNRSLLNPLEQNAGTQAIDLVARDGGIYDVEIFKKLTLRKASIILFNTQGSAQNSVVSVRIWLNPSNTFTIFSLTQSIPATSQLEFTIENLEIPFDEADIGTINVQAGHVGVPFFTDVLANYFLLEADLKDY